MPREVEILGTAGEGDPGVSLRLRDCTMGVDHIVRFTLAEARKIAAVITQQCDQQEAATKER